MTKKHYSLARIARAKAVEDWGVRGDSKDQVMKNQSTADSQEGALLELVRRLNQAIGAWSADKDLRDERDRDTPCSGDKPIPGLKLGDLLYYCNDVADGANCYVVVNLHESGIARAVLLDANVYQGTVYLNWCAEGAFYHSAEEALKAQAEDDLDHYERRYHLCRNILRALQEGGDYQAILDKWNEDRKKEDDT
jgi:hypothetical protein